MDKLKDFVTHIVKFYGVDKYGHIGISAHQLYDELKERDGQNGKNKS